MENSEEVEIYSGPQLRGECVKHLLQFRIPGNGTGHSGERFKLRLLVHAAHWLGHVNYDAKRLVKCAAREQLSSDASMPMEGRRGEERKTNVTSPAAVRGPLDAANARPDVRKPGF